MSKMFTVNFPQSLLSNEKKLYAAIKNGVRGTAESIRVDFVATTNTWKHKPKFSLAPADEFSMNITTDDNIWIMLDKGTRPHEITPKTPNGVLRFSVGGFVAKTRPNYLGSIAGARGATPTMRKRVWHPGTDARDWVQTAQSKYQDIFPKIVQRAIDAAATSRRP